MKVAHLCVATPGRCGLYETTRELVVGLRTLGIDSRIIDIPGSNKVYPQGYPQKWDRKAPLAKMNWAVKADIIVNHSGYDGTPVAETDQPIVHVAHGRPRSSFLSEANGSTKIYTYHYNKNFDPRWKAVVTFWPEHVPYLEVMFPDKPVHYVSPCVDLEYWCPGDSDYDFHGTKAKINVVCTDPKRDDNDAFIPMNAFALWAKDKDAKMHLFGNGKLNGYKTLAQRLNKNGNMGMIQGWKADLREVYRAADYAITSGGIATRSVREAMACGCPVVQVGPDLDYDPDFDREQPRADAERDFDFKSTAAQFKEVLGG